MPEKEEKKKFVYSLIFPVILIFIMWVVKLVEEFFCPGLAEYGILPGKFKGLIGIITAPFIHSDFQHLTNNSIPLFLLLTVTFYFYNEIALKIFVLIYFLANIGVWFVAREAYHIGSSGLVYGFASFLFFSGIIRRNVNLLAISLLVTFLYGSMVWGIFPLEINISWESHLMGAIAGFFISIVYRKEGPQRKEYKWEDDEDESDQDIFNDNEKLNKYIDSKIKK